MTPKPPRRPRQDSGTRDTTLVEVEMEVFPGDTVFPGRERLGRPARSPSLPPEDEPPAAADTPPPTN